MTLEIARVVQQAKNFDGLASEAVDHEMPGIAHSAKPGSRAVAAVPQMVDKNSLRQFLPILGAGTLGVRPDIQKRLPDQRIVTCGGVFAELPETPVEDGGDVALRRTADKQLQRGFVSHGVYRAEDCRVRAQNSGSYSPLARWPGYLP